MPQLDAFNDDDCGDMTGVVEVAPFFVRARRRRHEMMTDFTKSETLHTRGIFVVAGAVGLLIFATFGLPSQTPVSEPPKCKSSGGGLPLSRTSSLARTMT
jgi:hypothetical protein